MVPVEKKCHLCGVPLEEIEFLEPDLDARLPYDPAVRPPLCAKCWGRRVKEERAKRTAERRKP